MADRNDRNRRGGRRERVVEKQVEEEEVVSEAVEERPSRKHGKERREHGRHHRKEKESRSRHQDPEEEEQPQVEDETEPVEVSDRVQEEPSAQAESDQEGRASEGEERPSVSEDEEEDVPKNKKKSPPIVYSDVIGKATERDLTVLKNIAKGAPKFQHVYGTKDYADIVLIDSDKKEHYLSAVMLSSVIPRSLIADIMVCREERDNLCVLRLPISNIATDILVKYAYQIPIASVVSGLSLENKKQIIAEFDKIQAIPLISELYRDKELISIGDPKSIATWITTCATSGVSLVGQLPDITPAILKYLEVPTVQFVCRSLPPEEEIGIKLSWCCARETVTKDSSDRINEAQQLLQSINPAAKLPNLEKLTAMLHETTNPVVYRFLINKTLNTKLPLIPGPVNVPIERKSSDKLATPSRKPKSPGKVAQKP